MPDSDPAATGIPMDISQNLSSQSSAQISGQITSGGPPMRGGSSEDSSQNGTKQTMVKYGELIILGYNGQLPQGMPR